jgi:hypothetical protein
MLMRYYGGLAVGHTYAHGQTPFSVDQQAADGAPGVPRGDEQEFESAIPESGTNVVEAGSDSEDAFFDQDDLDMDGWDSNHADSDVSDDEAFLGMHEMYNAL